MTEEEQPNWGSHLPALMACCAVTSGPVIELGIGHFSTPVLHSFCGATKRRLVSIEENTEWFDRLKHLGVGHHTMLNGDYFRPLLDLASLEPYGVAFIDHSPGGESRRKAFEYLLTRSEFVVMHDAQQDAENFQAVGPLLTSLNWQLCTNYFPHTLVASGSGRRIPSALL